MKKVILCILDGVGIRKEKHGNAVKMAKMPTFNRFLKEYPNSLLEASGKLVGLPSNQMGNSEVGHMNIGMGRIIYQPLEIINQSIENKSFFKNEVILKTMKNAKRSGKKLHILGLLSDGGVHTNIHHLFALIDMAKKEGIEKLYIHAFLDGRDTLRDSSLTYLKQLEEKIQDLGIGKIATISGRYYAMDRDNNYDRIEKTYRILTEISEEKNYQNHIKESYQKGVYDEFIEPILVNKEGLIEENDFLMTFNFRPDRLRELFSTLTNPNFSHFETSVTNLPLVTMFEVSDEVIYEASFKHQDFENGLGEYLENKGYKQLRIAETEKYAHVTYFFDGGKEIELLHSKRLLIPSPKVSTYDLKPEMSALEITDTVLKELHNDYNLVVLNYANGDMVGHTGDMKATIQALETLDTCLSRLEKKAKENDYLLIITADHGNSDYMLDKNNNKITSHSKSKVPFIIADKKYQVKKGKLSDIAPTILYLMGESIPKEMTGDVLITKNLKKRTSKKKIFIWISFLTLFIMVAFYSYRFVHYYRLEHPKYVEKDLSLATHFIKANQESEISTAPKEYIVKGMVENNYVFYSNQLWRIVRINEDKSIVLITDDIVTSLVYGYESSDYDASYIKTWLNDVFYPSLQNPKEYVMEAPFCHDKNCDKTSKEKIGLLSYQEYVDAKANKSYLNIGKYFWTMTSSDENKNWYVFDEGGLNDEVSLGDTYYSYGVRPVIHLKPSVHYMSGDGTKENPYIFKENDQLSIGSYVNYGDYVFRILSKEETRIKLGMTDYITYQNQYVERNFSNQTSQYQSNDYNSLYSYLNNNFLKTLDTTYLVDGPWKVASYGVDSKYNYNNLESKIIEAKVGLFSISDLFLFDKVDYYTLTSENEDMIYIPKENGLLYASNISQKLKIRPAIYITSNVFVSEGNGTLENPYIIK